MKRDKCELPVAYRTVLEVPRRHRTNWLRLTFEVAAIAAFFVLVTSIVVMVKA